MQLYWTDLGPLLMDTGFQCVDFNAHTVIDHQKSIFAVSLGSTNRTMFGVLPSRYHELSKPMVIRFSK